MEQLTGGDIPVGKPVYQQEGVAAYSPEQAKIIFDNLMDARINGEQIPFLIVKNRNKGGRCYIRADNMIFHMLYHQGIDLSAIGMVETRPRAIIDYRKRIERRLSTSSDVVPDYSADFMDRPNFHHAPAIKVFKEGMITEMVLDPALCGRPQSMKEYTLNIGAEESNFNPLAKSPDLSELDQNHNILKDDRKEQTELCTAAKEHGVAKLPNCGPDAWEKVERHIHQASLKDRLLAKFRFGVHTTANQNVLM